MKTKLKYGLQRIPRPEYREQLRALVQKLGSGLPADKVQQAENMAMRAIEDYRESFPIPDGDLRTRGSLKEARTALQKFMTRRDESALQRSYMAKKEVYRQRERAPRPRDFALDSPEVEAAKALDSRADHETDEFREVLARDLAEILTCVFGLPIAMTRDDPDVPQPSHTGAAYARLLRASLLASGASPPTDLLPLMRAGKRLFDETSPDAEALD